jgi:hypothetical protein
VPEIGETAAGGADRAAENRLFLARGLPLVLSRADRSQRLLERSAPLVVALAAVGVITLIGLLLPDTTDTEYGESTIDPFVIALYAGFVVTVIVVPPATAWLVHRLITRSRRAVGRTLAVAIILAVVFVIPFLQDDVVPGAHFLTDAALNMVLVAVTVWLTYLGAGSILTWAAASAIRQVTAVGTLAARALPLVVLIVLVFFTGELWQLSARIPRARLWQTILFLLSISAVFLLATLRDELATIRAQRGAADRPLSRAEAVNVLIVMFLAQFLQIAVFAVVIFAFFLGLGLIALPPEVIEMWTGSPPQQGTWFGVRVPVSQALIHMSMLVAAFSTMYFTVSSSTDPQYRDRFFDPLVEDMADTLSARDRYLERWYPRG